MMPNRMGGFGLNYEQGFRGMGQGSRGFVADFGNPFDQINRLMDRRHQAGLLGQQERGDTQRARIAARANTLPARLQQNRFNQVFPFMKDQLGALTSGGGVFSAGGQSPASPEITVGPIWSNDQIQQQVNAMRAASDQETAGKTTDMQRQLAGRGFGANSPLAQALGVQYQGMNLANKTGQERELRFGAAGENAAHLLKTQQAREGQFASRQQEDIERRKPYLQTLNTLLGALSGLV